MIHESGSLSSSRQKGAPLSCRRGKVGMGQKQGINESTLYTLFCTLLFPLKYTRDHSPPEFKGAL